MKRLEYMTTCGLRDVSREEMRQVRGGVDKKVKDVMYAIGYAIGYVCRAIAEVFEHIGDWFTKDDK